jgi:predicted nicotinamide N-methyase
LDGQIFSEKNARAEAKRYRRKGLDGTSRRIADLLRERGVEGKTLLEVGAASALSRSICSRQVSCERSMLS